MPSTLVMSISAGNTAPMAEATCEAAPGVIAVGGSAGAVEAFANAAKMATVTEELANRVIETPSTAADAAMELENEIALLGSVGNDLDVGRLGPPSGFTCPDCHGSLQTVADGNFRCHIGHAWSGEALLSARDHEVDGALSVAVRSLQDKTRLARQLADHTRSDFMRERYRVSADEAEWAVKVLHDRFTSTGAGPTVDDG